MGKITRRTSAAAAAMLVALATSFVVASAHYVFTAGKYRIAIGWQFEPAGGTDTYVGAPNAIQVFIEVPSASNPIGTPATTLNEDCTHPDFQVTVTVGATTSSPYCPVPLYDSDTGSGRLDEYDYAVIPTVVGSYTFHIFGIISGVPIDQKVTSGPTTFDSIADSSAVDFPVVLPAAAAVAIKVETVGQRAASALASAQSASTAAGDAKASAAGATTLAIVAIGVAVLLSAVNVAIGLRRRST